MAVPLPSPGTAGVEEAHRLPRTCEPHRYRLHFVPDLEAARFTGSLSLELSAHHELDAVTLHAAELEIEDAEWEPDGGPVTPLEVHLHPDDERVVFTPTARSTLPAGPAVLRCRFAGILNDRLRGLYRSTFVDQEGEERTIATTQMEATDARRAFPCFDEPDYKAVFELSVEVDPGLEAFSNASVAEVRELGGGRRSVRFSPTMKMSTYLVALVVGPLEATDPVVVDGIPLRVVHVPGKGHLSPYALEVAAFALRFFAGYFDLPYPAEKLDLVAIPDFAFGAMENLGCVTFRESALLVDPEAAARTELERVADVVSHEIAHMWFGDLVTMRWWNGIWLNEAFATFMEVLCVDAFRPAWQRWVSFGLEREAAMAVDGLHSTRPVEYPVGAPEEAEGMFDVLTYQKGGSVLRMLEQYLGPEVFRDGVRAYLRRHAHANTDTQDLWEALETVSGEPVREVMDSWILQGGYPLVRLKGAEVSEEPFTYAQATGESAIGGPWRVPVLARQLDGGQVARLLVRDACPLPPPHDGPVLLNAGGFGYYRAAYPPEDLAEVAARLPGLSTLERANLLSDTWALVLCGRLGPGTFFDLASRLGEDADPSTWSVVVGALVLVDKVAADEDRPAVSATCRALLGPRLAALGWERRPDESERVPTLRALLVRTLGTVGEDPLVRERAANLFDSSHRHGVAGAVDPDLEAAVLEVVAATNRAGDFELVLDRYRHPATPQDELRHLYALAAFPDPDKATRLFDLTLHEVRSQNAPFVVQGLLMNRVVGEVVWDLVKRHFEALVERLPLNTHSRMLDGVRGLCRHRAVADDVEAFLRAHPLRSGQRSVTQTLERLSINVAFGEAVRPSLAATLAPFAS